MTSLYGGVKKDDDIFLLAVYIHIVTWRICLLLLYFVSLLSAHQSMYSHASNQLQHMRVLYARVILCVYVFMFLCFALFRVHPRNGDIGDENFF